MVSSFSAVFLLAKTLINCMCRFAIIVHTKHFANIGVNCLQDKGNRRIFAVAANTMDGGIREWQEKADGRCRSNP